METAIRRFIAEHETAELTRRELSLGRGNETLYLNNPDGLSVQTSGTT